MAKVTESIEVDVPVTIAYNQWTQFESFPEFMGGVESVTQLDDTTNHWKTKVGGVEREFDTRIIEQEPDRLIAWQSIDGKSHAGRVAFEPVFDDDAGARLGGTGADAGTLAPDLSAGTSSDVQRASGGARTRVTVEFVWDDETFLEKVGGALGIDSLQVKGDLRKYKDFVESRGGQTGGWRGEVSGGQVEGGTGGLGGTGYEDGRQ
jgi:carbon monoxide dehydrogenase subunit G